MIRLAWLLFGNGWGVASPHCDDVFYWLHDQWEKARWYHWGGGFGSQLTSFEWRMPKPGTARTLAAKRFRVFDAERSWFLVRVTWGIAPAVKDAEEIRELEQHIKNWGHGK